MSTVVPGKPGAVEPGAEEPLPADAASQDVATAPYRDPAVPLDERIADLLARMTVAEKVAQLGSVWAFEIVPDGRLHREQMRSALGVGLGEITRLAGATNLRAAQVAEAANEIQRFLLEETRLGIPAIVHEETLHGLLARDAPSFQQSIGAAATWDPELTEAVAATIRERMLATGARHALAPVLDIARDPRWGRIEETYGEDPYLTAAMGVAYTRGLQGTALSGGVIATGKHFAGHGLGEGGLNMAPAHAGWRELRDEQLFSFEAAIREADIGSVMPAYSELDGIPCHMSRELLETILRGEWGFDGIVASDYVAIEQLVRQHRMTDDLGTAAALTLRAGVDLELPRSAAYAEPLAGAIADGRAREDDLDAAVGRVLRAKFRLGLFENPYVEVPAPAFLATLAAEETRVGVELARRSIVLLENDGVLPLTDAAARVAVIGPIADSARDLLGDYSHLVHIETLVDIRNDPAFGFLVNDGVSAHDAVSLEDEVSGRRTILDAIRDRFGDERVVYSRGTGISDGEEGEIAAAAQAARAADVALLFLGERSGLTLDATTGETRDRRDLGFMGDQQELLEAVVATGTPVVLVVVSGRPLAIEWAKQHCAAVLMAWVPGDAGPDAIADVLTGVENPGGKLPVSVPRHVGQVPYTYRHHPSGGRSNWRVDHVDGPAGPLWPFGHGRSYTQFGVSSLRTSAATIPTEGGELDVTVEVTNTGNRAGDEVVQLYARDNEAQVARPVKELCGFRRVHLQPGDRACVTFTLSAEQFSYTGEDYQRCIEPGRITLMAGTSSADLPLSTTIELVGPTLPLPVRRRFLTPTSVSQG